MPGMVPKIEDFLVRTGGNVTALVLLMACSLLPLSLFPMSPVAGQNVSYSLNVVARSDLEQVDVGVPIYLDDYQYGVLDAAPVHEFERNPQVVERERASKWLLYSRSPDTAS